MCSICGRRFTTPSVWGTWGLGWVHSVARPCIPPSRPIDTYGLSLTVFSYLAASKSVYARPSRSVVLQRWWASCWQLDLPFGVRGEGGWWSWLETIHVPQRIRCFVRIGLLSTLAINSLWSRPSSGISHRHGYRILIIKLWNSKIGIPYTRRSYLFQ